MVIHSGNVTDISAIQTIARRVWLSHYPGIITHRQIEYMLELDYSDEALLGAFEEGMKFDLLMLDDTIRGFAAYGKAVQQRGTKLHKLYLDESFHGQGYGSTLLNHVIDQCRDRGDEMLELQVNKHNARAIRAYERAGFARTASILKPIGQGFFMDDYVMTLPLRSRGQKITED